MVSLLSERLPEEAIVAIVLSCEGKVLTIQTFDGSETNEFKRSTENFKELHKKLMRELKSYCPRFPKRYYNYSIRKSAQNGDESRRIAFEQYLQDLVQLQPLPSVISTFLELRSAESLMGDATSDDAVNQTPHAQGTPQQYSQQPKGPGIGSSDHSQPSATSQLSLVVTPCTDQRQFGGSGESARSRSVFSSASGTIQSTGRESTSLSSNCSHSNHIVKLEPLGCLARVEFYPGDQSTLPTTTEDKQLDSRHPHALAMDDAVLKGVFMAMGYL